MITVFKCADCYHANKAEDDAPCYWCGSRNRVTILPVRTANMQQNTPGYADLVADMDREEANRFTETPLEDQIKALIAKYFEERENYERFKHESAQKAAEG